MITENRRADRITLDQIINLVFAHNRKLPAKAVNVSSTGLLVAIDEEVETGTHVDVNFCAEIGDCSKIIKAEGIVTRSAKGMRDYFAAIDFTIIDGEKVLS